MIFLEACGVAFCLGVGYALGRTVVLGAGELFIERRIQKTNASTLAKVKEAKTLMKDDPGPGYRADRGGYA